MRHRSFRTLVIAAALVVGTAGAAPGQSVNPLLFVSQPLVPDAVAPGSPGFTVTVNGTGFVSGSTVNWNASPRVTTFVSSSQLTASINAADVAGAGTGSVTVTNPAPGGGTSNVIFFPVAASIRSVILNPGTNYPTAFFPLAVATADLNGDGKLDLVASTSSGLAVLLGNGDGTFQPTVSYPACGFSFGLAAVDVNGDGKVDIVQNASTGVCVSLGNGDGTFQAPIVTPYSLTGPIGLAVADFNADGKLDVAVTDNVANTVSVLLGNGDGTFQSPNVYAAGNGTFGITAGDLNGDGKLDLVATNFTDQTLSVFYGNGDGTFQAQQVLGGAGPGTAVVAADFNGDGKLDLAVGGANNQVAVFLTSGGGLDNAKYYPTGTEDFYTIIAADFNADGKLDLAVTAYGVSVLLGNGNGTFQSYSQFGSADQMGALVAGDFNADGYLDLAAADDATSGISVSLETVEPVLAGLPASLTFGTETVGTKSAGQTVTLTNTGNASLTISSLRASAGFVQHNTCGSAVAAGANCTITVASEPLHAGTATGKLTITDNASGSPQTVSLTGTGTFFELSPTSLSFGNVTKGQTSPPQMVTLKNVATNSQNVGIRLTGVNPGAFAETNTCGTSLGAGASCTISVTFTPKFKGAASATLQVSGGGGPNLSVSLSGTGVS